MTARGIRVGTVVRDTDGTELVVGRHAVGLPHHRHIRVLATGRHLGVLLSDEFLHSLAFDHAGAVRFANTMIEGARNA